MNLEPNRQFGQYRVIRLLGRGGMGEVYEVEHRVLRRRYALKLLPVDFAERRESIQRFEREAEVMANLEHPHIVRVDEDDSFLTSRTPEFLLPERGLVRGFKKKIGKDRGINHRFSVFPCA